MEESSYFQKALSDFTYETAIGGAVRHLADSGYTVCQIVEQLDFPTAYERVQKAVWEHLVRQGTILLEPPGKCRSKETVTYVREYDSYGKASFRRVVIPEKAELIVTDWDIQTQSIDSTKKAHSIEDFLVLLQGKCDVNGVDYAYATLDFGILSQKDPSQYKAMLLALDAHQREYVVGLPWEKRRVYHKLNSHGMEIVIQLYGAGFYHGECFFLKTRDRIRII